MSEPDPNSPIWCVWAGGFLIASECTAAQADKIMDVLWAHHKAHIERLASYRGPSIAEALAKKGQ